MPQNILITATSPNQGKTAVTIGLTAELVKRVKHIGFIKPIGQADRAAGRHRVDEDTLLIEKACRVHCSIGDMNPIVIDSGFPAHFLNPSVLETQVNNLKAAYGRIAEGKEIVVMEGSGHAAAGASFGLSNAFIAKTFDAKVLLVSSGGVGQACDKILLSRQYFENEGVQLIGAIFNKVTDADWENVTSIGKTILEDRGIRFLGAIPYRKDLYVPTMLQVLECLRGTLLHGEKSLSVPIGNIGVGAMQVSNALQRLSGPTLLVVPGDRDDLILGALSARTAGWGNFSLTGIVLTGNIQPSSVVVEMIKKTDVPAILVEPNSYETTARLHSLPVKISPWDREKIDTIVETFAQHVDCERLVKLLSL